MRPTSSRQKSLRNPLLLAVVIAVLCAVSTGAPRAESSAEAMKWIEKLSEITAQGAFRVEFEGTVQMTQMNQEMKVSMKGSTLHGGSKRMKIDSVTQMDMGGMQMNVEMLGVSDGETMWLEMNSPMMGGRQVMKLPVDKMAEMGNNVGMGSGGGLDPFSQVEEMSRNFDFVVDDVSGGEVRLVAKMNEETREKLRQAIPDADALDEMVVILDEKTGFPKKMRMGGAEPIMEMTFHDPEFMDSVDDSEFAYTPPEGVKVMDLGAMQGMGAGG